MTTRVLTVEEVVAPADAASGLRLPPGARARRAELIRHLGAVPVSHLSAYFPATPRFRQVTGPAVAARPLLALTEALGGPVRELVQTIGAVLAAPPLSELLAIDAGAPLVRVARRLIGRDGPLQYSVAHYRADCFSLETIEVQSGKGWRREMRMQLAEHDGLPRQTRAPRAGRRVARPG
jgi:GntR family transcriptional regulator